MLSLMNEDRRISEKHQLYILAVIVKSKENGTIICKTVNEAMDPSFEDRFF
jgi:hypothetical protein